MCLLDKRVIWRSIWNIFHTYWIFLNKYICGWILQIVYFSCWYQSTLVYFSVHISMLFSIQNFIFLLLNITLSLLLNKFRYISLLLDTYICNNILFLDLFYAWVMTTKINNAVSESERKLKLEITLTEA
jgi:hypothetical protein